MTRHVLPIALLGLVLAACGGGNNNPSEAAQTMMADLSLDTLRLENPTVVVKLPGEIVSDHEAPIHAKVQAFVRELRADIGDRVSKGQVLAMLEAPELQAKESALKAQVKAQEAVVAYSRSQYERLEKAALTPGAVATIALERAQSQWQSDREKLSAAQAALGEVSALTAYLTLRAPFDGVVSERTADVGSLVAPGTQPVMVVREERALRLRVKVSEKHTPFVGLETDLSFAPVSAPAHRQTARVSRTSGALDSRLRSETLEADFSNEGGHFLPGMVVDVEVPLRASEPSFFVPRSAIVDGNMGVYVMAVREGKTERVDVRKGRILGMRQEIFGKLSEGERILKKITEETPEGLPL